MYSKKRCKRCGREITSEKSLERGFGPTCWNKVKMKGYPETDLEEKYNNIRKKLTLEDLVNESLRALEESG